MKQKLKKIENNWILFLPKDAFEQLEINPETDKLEFILNGDELIIKKQLEKD